MGQKYGVNTDEYDEEVREAAAEYLRQEEEAQPVTSDDIVFVLTVISKEAPHDRQSIKQLLLGMLSAFTRLPIHHAISSKDSGAGKSYLLVLVAGYIPKMYVVSLTGMSDKAMLHKAGILVVEDDDGEPVPLDPLVERLEDSKEELIEQLNNLPNNTTSKEERRKLKEVIADKKAEIKDLMMKAEKLIVLENKIILLLDTTQDSLFNALMSLVSQDTKDDQKYEYVDTSSNVAISTKTNRFKGTPAIFTCQVVDDSRQVRYAEKNRRFIHVIPNTSSDKIQTAMDQIGLRYGLLPEEYDTQVVSREDKKKVKRICGRLVRKLIAHSQHFEPKDTGIKVLFPKAITRSIVKSPNDVWGMTVAERINKYLAVITKMNMDSRPRFIDIDVPGGKKFYSIATFNDVKETLELMGLASSTSRIMTSMASRLNSRIAMATRS
jgi:hypothetical protein